MTSEKFNAATETPSLIGTLTRAELGVLLWVSEGKRNAEIAAILSRSKRTVDAHICNILRKLGVETRGCAARIFLDHRIHNGTQPVPPKARTQRKNLKSTRQPT